MYRPAVCVFLTFRGFFLFVLFFLWLLVRFSHQSCWVCLVYQFFPKNHFSFSQPQSTGVINPVSLISAPLLHRFLPSAFFKLTLMFIASLLR